jgi:electron transport complex protein RnfC
MLKLFPAAKCCIGIEMNKPKAIDKLKELTSNEDRIEVCPLKTKYPQGGERMLIKAITGISINSSMLPLNAGCIVDNVSTVVAIYNAVCKNIPLIERVMTITGDAVNSPCNVEVPIGMSHSRVIEAAGGFKDWPKKIISGGPMMGNAMYTLDVPVVKTSGSVLAMSKDEVADAPVTACIRCGSCLKACPENLVPQLLMIAADNNNFQEFEKLGGMECMECGSCSYVCPAKTPPSIGIQSGTVDERLSARSSPVTTAL